jgi:hypothetical protein
MKIKYILPLAIALSCLAHAGDKTAQPVGSSPATTPANPLSFADGRVVFGIEDQTRFEYRENNFDFNSGIRTVNDDSWFLNRFRLSLQLKPSDWITFYVQAQDSREMGSKRANIPGVLGAEGDNPFDLRQAYIEIGNENEFPLSLKAGRQVLLYGDQRLIGPLDWSNLSRTFDAAKLRWTGNDGLWVDAFVSSVVVPDRNGFDESDWNSVFSGVYAHIPSFGIQDTELYVLNLDDTNRGDHFVTLGTHIKSQPGKLGAWDYEAEFAVQTGTAGGKDLSAFASYIEGGYTFANAWKPRIGLEYSYGSGDGNAADGKQGAFQNLYPTNHPHYGYMDVFSWSNMHDAVLHLSAKPTAKLTTSLDWHSFWLANTADSWRRANAKTTVRTADAAASNYAGSELDALVSYAACVNFTLTAGYSHFFAGSYLNDTGAGSDADFVYVMTSVKF